MSVLDNVTLAPIKAKKLPKAQAEEIGRKFLDQVGILNQAEKYPAELSGG